MQGNATASIAEQGAEAATPQGRRAADSPEPNLLSVLALLWRRKGLILSTVILTTLAAVLLVFQVTPRYTAEARILFGTRAAKVVDIERVLGALRSDRATISSEVEVLSSRSLAEKVVDRLGLVDRPEFNRHLRPSSLPDPRDWLPPDLRTTLFGTAPDTPATAAEADRQVRSDVITALQEATTVDVINISRVVSVTAISEDPSLAAAIANALTDIYLREHLEEKLDATRQAADWLSERVRTLRDQVESSQRAVEDFRQKQGLIQARDTTLVEQQIYEVNTQLISAQTKTAEADARLRHARGLMRTKGRGVDAASEVLSAPLIQQLRMEEAKLAGEKAQMASEYGKRHPKMINVTAELADIRAKIGVEVRRIVRGLENSLEVAQTRQRTLQRSLDKLKAEASRLTASQARLRLLERDAAANQNLYDTFLARWKETGEQDALHRADARIISRATVPSEPSWPNKPAAVSIALVGSMLLALLLVFFVEQVLDRGVRDAEQIENLMGMGTLGMVPMLAGSRTSLFDHVLNEPTSSFSESLRMLHAGLQISDSGDARSQTVLITSSVAEEGKTFIALSLARLMARSGRKVLLIDADLRHGQIAQRLRLPSRRGLADLLTGRLVSADDAIQRDELSGLHVLTVGRRDGIPTDILQSESMRRLMEKLRPHYELIVVDSPPALLVSDARTLARLMDKTVFVVRWSETARKVAVAGFRQLVESKAQMAGVVLSMAKPRRGDRYSYYGPGAYGWSSKYGRYYSR